MTDMVSTMRYAESGAGAGVPRVDDVSTTWLTKRRAVDHCRVRSALCPSC